LSSEHTCCRRKTPYSVKLCYSATADAARCSSASFWREKPVLCYDQINSDINMTFKSTDPMH